MAKNLVQLFKSDPSAKLERLRDKMLAAEATLASVETERAILSAEVHSDALDRKELDRCNERHERASRLVAELKAAIVAAEQEVAAKEAQDRQDAQAALDAKVQALGDRRRALAEEIEGEAAAIAEKLIVARQIAADISALVPRGQHESQLDGAAFVNRTLNFIRDRVGVALNPVSSPPASLVAAVATGEQLVEMANRPRHVVERVQSRVHH